MEKVMKKKKLPEGEKIILVNNKLYLGIDPGKDKCGIALLRDDLTPVILEIIETKELDSYLEGLYHKYEIELIILGNGTYSEKIKKIVDKKNFPSIVLVDEKSSTFQAEKRYRENNPLKGYKKILNKIARWRPASDVDDYADLILAEKNKKNRKN